MRLKLTSRIWAIDETMSVLARPGTPTSRQCPRVKMAASICSITSFCPTITRPSCSTIWVRVWENWVRYSLMRSGCTAQGFLKLGPVNEPIVRAKLCPRPHHDTNRDPYLSRPVVRGILHPSHEAIPPELPRRLDLPGPRHESPFARFHVPHRSRPHRPILRRHAASFVPEARRRRSGIARFAAGDAGPDRIRPVARQQEEHKSHLDLARRRPRTHGHVRHEARSAG